MNWQGSPAQPDARQMQPVTLTLKSGTTEVNYPSHTTDASGFFTVSVSGLSNGVYNWRAKGPNGTPNTNTIPGFMATCGTVTLAGAAQTNVEMGLQLAADANNDNLISVLDFNILKTQFGTSGHVRSDFTNDNVVNVLDFNLMKGNFSLSGCGAP